MCQHCDKLHRAASTLGTHFLAQQVWCTPTKHKAQSAFGGLFWREGSKTASFRGDDDCVGQYVHFP
eukprot:1853325-Rhodomonas_salina.1